MPFNRSVLPFVLFGSALAGCSTASEDYPSLAIREAERVSGTMEAIPPQPYIPPATPAGVVDRLDQLVADAAGANEAFGAEAPGARTLVAAARGAQPGAESWARAQVALANLEASRSRAMIALADLDRLYVDAAVEGAELERIAAARDTVATQVEQQNAAIAALAEGLPR